MFACEQCGCLVEGMSTQLHLDWHKENNECFAGAALLIRDLKEQIAQLEERLGSGT